MVNTSNRINAKVMNPMVSRSSQGLHSYRQYSGKCLFTHVLGHIKLSAEVTVDILLNNQHLDFFIMHFVESFIQNMSAFMADDGSGLGRVSTRILAIV